MALDHVTPSVAQVIIQLAPLLLLVAALVLFFNDRLPELAGLHAGLGQGVALTVAAAVSLAIYGLAQKKLHEKVSSQQVLWVIHAGAVILLLTASTPLAFRGLDGLQLGMLGFCCVNTLAAYGSFGEALHHWELSRVPFNAPSWPARRPAHRAW